MASLIDEISTALRVAAGDLRRQITGVIGRFEPDPVTSPASAAGTMASLIPVVDEWDVVSVREALRQHEYGQLYRSALLADHMTRQDRIAGVLQTRLNAVLGLERDVSPGDDSLLAETAADLFDPRWEESVSRGALATLLRWLILEGVVICHRAYERDPITGRWVVRLIPWHPAWCRWDHTMQVWRVSTRTGQEVCPPDGSNPRWCALTLVDGERPWMAGAVRWLAIPFLIVSWAYRDWARWSEKHGLPPLGAKVPAGERAQKATDAFLADLQQLATEPTILLPQGVKDQPSFDLEWKELKNWQSYQGFADLASKVETNVAIGFLGQNLTTEVQGGSFAAARAHELVRQDVLAADLSALTQGLRDAVAVPWARINVAADPAQARRIAPRPRLVVPVGDEEDRAKLSIARAESVKAWRDAGATVDAQQAARDAGMPVVTVSTDSNLAPSAPGAKAWTPTETPVADDAPTVAVMLPLPQDVAARVALPDGEPAGDLHVTLCVVALTDDRTLPTLREVVRRWAEGHAPMFALLAGVGRFTGPEGVDPLYLSVDARELAAAREALVAAVLDADLAVSVDHGFTPHVTLLYAPHAAAPDVALDAPIALTFDRVALWQGDAREEIALSGAVQRAAIPTRYEHIDFTPPQGVRDACARGVALHEEGLSGPGLEPATVAWARRLARGERISPAKARRMARWFGRNGHYGAAPKDSPAWVAFCLWGGRPGESWSRRLVRMMDTADAAVEG